MKKVRILLSLYNSNDFYLLCQIKSLSNQIGVKVSLSVRFDFNDNSEKRASSERLINSYFDEVEYFEGDNIGPALSYMELVRNCKKDSDYYAFCDQDDFWLPSKLWVATEFLRSIEQRSQYAAYCSSLIYTDEYLSVCGKSRVPSYCDFENALIENVVTGCTLVINLNLIKLSMVNLPSKLSMHDSWFYLLATSLESLFFDANSYVYYRQHGANVVGSNATVGYYLKKIKLFIEGYSSKSEREVSQVHEFVSCYVGIVNEEYLERARLFIACKKKFRLRLKGLLKYRRNRSLDDLIFKVKLILGKI